MKKKNELIADALYKYDAHARKILDVGYAQLPNEYLKGEIYGIDIARVEKPTTYQEVRVVDLNNDVIPFRDGYFDAVTMGCVLAHVANPLRVLLELHRVVKDDGYLVFSSPNPNYYWETVLNIFYCHFKDRVSQAKHIEHFYSFNRYNVRTLANRVGFTLEKEFGCLFALVKTKLRYNPLAHPGMAYEIVYVLKKTDLPRHVTTIENEEGIVEIETSY